MSSGLIGALLNYAAKLKFRTLFLIATGLFVLSLIIPDPLPFIDELFLGLVVLLLSSWKNKNLDQNNPQSASQQQSKQQHKRPKNNKRDKKSGQIIEGEFERKD